MTKFSVIHSFAGVTIREYVSDNFNSSRSYFRIDTNLKRNIFEVWFIDSHHNCNFLFALGEPRKILRQLGYELNDFSNYMMCGSFVLSIVDMIKYHNFRKIKVSSGFVSAFKLHEYLLK